MADFNNFAAIGNALEKASVAANEEIAMKAVEHIKDHILANGQVVTGDMLNSVHNEAQDDGSQNVVVGVDYGIYPNYGTSRQPAKPFFEPGLDDTVADVEVAFEEIINALSKVGI